jgi:glycosyltransferase involved in cell wall biosynthesis
MKIHFFTIVRNGLPFLPHHIDVFRNLNLKWHWHIVEGLADLKHDTAWSVQTGGKLPVDAVQNTLSTDGSTQYLDKLREEYPARITIYRKSKAELWDGKLEMVQAPLINVYEECLLWQIDVDEFWSPESIEQMHKAFLENPTKTAAWYWCNFFVAADKIVSTRNCYSQNPNQEWLRTWRFKYGDFWKAHEPPLLCRKLSDGKEVDVGKIDPFLHHETEKLGAVFEHFAYSREEQVRFKEQYYGYTGAVAGWNQLSATQENQPKLLSSFFPWVKDSTYIALKRDLAESPYAMVLIDGVAFQDSWNPGICRVWRSVLEKWVEQGFSRHFSVLDRNGTFPEIPGVNRIKFSRWEKTNCARDAIEVEAKCRETQSRVFVSTLNTFPIETPSVVLLHDFIPEKLGAHVESSSLVERQLAINYASRFVCVSKSTKNDLNYFFPYIKEDIIAVATLGVSPSLRKVDNNKKKAFKDKYGILKPYFLLVGERVGLLGEVPPARGYKNAELFFKAANKWERITEFDIVVIGGAPHFEKELSAAAPNLRPILIRATEEELAAAYSGATALIYPSKYEGFGLPVAEAMKCGCPVITSNTSSLPEVGGAAPIYIDPENEDGLIYALERIASGVGVESMVELGLREADRFSWDTLANALWESLMLTANEGSSKQIVWRELRNAQETKRAEKTETKRLQNEITSLKKSLSWRCTAPLRGIDGILRFSGLKK